MNEYNINLIKQKCKDHFDNEILLLNMISQVPEDRKEEIEKFMLTHPHAQNVNKISTKQFQDIKDKINKK